MSNLFLGVNKNSKKIVENLHRVIKNASLAVAQLSTFLPLFFSEQKKKRENIIHLGLYHCSV